MSPSPPGGPAAHRVAIISFPVTKEVRILWSPHRGGEGSGEAALEPLAHTQRGGRDDDADLRAAPPGVGARLRHAAAMGQRPGRASAALPGVRLHGWSGRKSGGVSPGAEPPPPVPRWANCARSSSSSSSNSSYPEPRPRGGEGGGGGRRPCCCRLAARGAGRGTARGGDGRREAEERRGRACRRLRADPTLINSRGAGGSRGAAACPAALGCAGGGAGRRRTRSAEKAATKERNPAPPKPGFCSPLPGSAALPPPRRRRRSDHRAPPAAPPSGLRAAPPERGSQRPPGPAWSPPGGHQAAPAAAVALPATWAPASLGAGG